MVERIQPGERVLDIGCGMGGLLARLDAAGACPTGLTPNRAHVAHIRTQWPHIPLLEGTLESFDPRQRPERFDAVINSESFQCIALDEGIERVKAFLAPNGRWVVIDYFRLNCLGIEAWHQLESELPGQLPLRWGGSVEWVVDAARAERMREGVRKHQAWGYPMQLLDAVIKAFKNDHRGCTFRLYFPKNEGIILKEQEDIVCKSK